MEWNTVVGLFLIFGVSFNSWYRSTRKQMEAGPPYESAHNDRVSAAVREVHDRLTISGTREEIAAALDPLLPNVRGGVLQTDDRRSYFVFGSLLFAVVAVWLIYKSFPSVEPLLKPPVISWLTLGCVIAMVAIQVRVNRRRRRLSELDSLIKHLLMQMDQRYTRVLDIRDRQRWLTAHLSLCPGLLPAGAERATAHTLVHGNYPNPSIIFSVIGIHYEATEHRLSTPGEIEDPNAPGWVEETVSHERAVIVFPPQMAKLFSAKIIERLANEKVSVVRCDSGYTYTTLPSHPFSGDAMAISGASLSIHDPGRLIDAIRSEANIDSPLLTRINEILAD